MNNIKENIMQYTKAKQMLFLLWIIAAVLILLNILLWGESHARAVDDYNDLTAEQTDMAREMEAKYLMNPDQDPLRFSGDTTIERNETVNRDIVVVEGTITIEGHVGGSVLCLYGDVELQDGAYVEGDVVSVEGIVWTDDGSSVEGDIIETGKSYSRQLTMYDDDDDDDRDIEKDRDYDRDRDWDRERDQDDYISIKYRYDKKDDEPIFFDYNRVDGMTLGLNFPSAGWWNHNRHDFAILGKAGYSFARREWQYQLGLEKWFLSDNRLSIGAEYHDLTSSEDDWIISDMENALAAILFKEDFRDYYLKKGYSVYISQDLTYFLNVKLAYNENEFLDLDRNANWAVFGGDDKKFRTNPPALPAGFVEQQQSGIDALTDPALELGSYSATVTFDTRDRTENPQHGWYIQAFGERSEYLQLESTTFDRYIVDARFYYPMGWDENLNIRLRGGTTRGDVPPMYWYDLGGISTLRGFKFKEFTGDRMVLGNVEYRMRTSQDDWFIFDTFDIILFMDSGLAWFADDETPERVNAWQYEQEEDDTEFENGPKDSFNNLTWNSLKTNIGVGLATDDDMLRINFAKRTDIGGQDFVVTFRLNHTF